MALVAIRLPGFCVQNNGASVPCTGSIAKVDATSATAEDIAQLRRAVHVEAGRRYALLSAERVICSEGALGIDTANTMFRNGFCSSMPSPDPSASALPAAMDALQHNLMIEHLLPLNRWESEVGWVLDHNQTQLRHLVECVTPDTITMLDANPFGAPGRCRRAVPSSLERDRFVHRRGREVRAAVSQLLTAGLALFDRSDRTDTQVRL